MLAENEITFGTTLIEIGSPFAQLLPVDSTAVASAAYINNGVYFIRGHFVDVQSANLILEQYSNNPSYRIGLEVSESIVTPEDDPSLNDNAAGTSNYSAPGGHRFKIKTTLVKKAINDSTDKNFVELLRINNSKVEQFVDSTAYSEARSLLHVGLMKSLVTMLLIPSASRQESVWMMVSIMVYILPLKQLSKTILLQMIS